LLWQTAILGTSHILVIRKVLQSQSWTLSSDDHCWSERSTERERSVTRRKQHKNNNKNYFIIIIIIIIVSPVNISSFTCQIILPAAHTLYFYLAMYSIFHTLSFLLSTTSLVTNMGILHCWNIMTSPPEYGTDVLKTWAT
jgi:hypothetical protein